MINSSQWLFGPPFTLMYIEGVDARLCKGRGRGISVCVCVFESAGTLVCSPLLPTQTQPEESSPDEPFPLPAHPTRAQAQQKELKH